MTIWESEAWKSSWGAYQDKVGVGVADLLTLLFIGLKLTGHITWSWWWVLAPEWISLIGVIVITRILILMEGRP